jgi:hypothetical protein
MPSFVLQLSVVLQLSPKLHGIQHPDAENFILTLM